MSRLGRKSRELLLDERGSISILTIGLFTLLLSTVVALSNISAVYLAKRTLILATEAAVQRGAQNLDKGTYYSGEYNLTDFLRGVVGHGEEDPGIPIDCKAGARDAEELISYWQGRGRNLTRAGISQMKLTNFQCDGFQIYLESEALVNIPFPLPFFGIDEVQIRGSAGGVGERSETNNYYGIDLG